MMFEIYVENDLPYMKSPYETTSEQFQNLFERALKTGCLLRFTLECLSPAKNHDSVEIEPTFDVKFGHFGFKIRGLNKETMRRLNWVWPPLGRLIDFRAFHHGLSELGGMWMVNHLSFTPIGKHKYRSIPTCNEPLVHSTSSEDWDRYLVIHHSFAGDETVPYRKEGERELLGRWYRNSESKEWDLEWIHMTSERLMRYSTSLYHRSFHQTVYPLVDDNELVSDFLDATEFYIPPNFVPSLSVEKKVEQLRDAIWWMECRYRFLPRYTKHRLNELIEETSVEEDEFQLPMMNQSLHTTEILRIYSERGNAILGWLTTRTY